MSTSSTTSESAAPVRRYRHRRSSTERAVDRMDGFVHLLNDILFERVSEKPVSSKEESEAEKADRVREEERAKYSFGMVVLLKAVQYVAHQDSWDEETRKLLVKYYYDAVGRLRVLETAEKLKKGDQTMLEVKLPDVIEKLEEYTEELEEIPATSDVEYKFIQAEKVDAPKNV